MMFIKTLPKSCRWIFITGTRLYYDSSKAPSKYIKVFIARRDFAGRDSQIQYIYSHGMLALLLE